MSSDLEKFTTCDLLKTFDKLGEHLQKSAPDKMKEIIAKYGGADMAKKEVAKEAKDYDPNAETPKTTVEEKDKPPAKEVSADTNTKIGKDDYNGAPGGMPGGDETSPGTQADVLTQILEAIQDLKAMLAQMYGGNGGVPPGGNEVQMADKEVEDKDKEVEKDVPPVTAPASEKQIASIVVKALDEKFKELGLVKTEKPAVETSHPIQKAGGKKALTMEEIGKMSWTELTAYLEQ